MEIIKLNRRYKAFKLGYRVAVRFTGYAGQGADWDRACIRVFGSQYPRVRDDGTVSVWRDWFDARRVKEYRGVQGRRPYFVGFTDEKYLAWLRLSMQEVDPK
jgi:hypothetical protein